ncbi:hypothetical protein TNCV_2625381 [Trichonephila clavipes]|nr:hypothetical protein TNCV_2625381 [Trichonephila clavipes]
MECAAFHSRRESITGKSPTYFPGENTTMPYSRFEPEPTRLQAKDRIHLTGWAARYLSTIEKMPYRRIRAHYEQLSEFERDHIIGLKEAGLANRRITRHIG